MMKTVLGSIIWLDFRMFLWLYINSLLEEGRKRIPDLPQIWLVMDSGSGDEIDWILKREVEEKALSRMRKVILVCLSGCVVTLIKAEHQEEDKFSSKGHLLVSTCWTWDTFEAFKLKYWEVLICCVVNSRLLIKMFKICK